MMCLKLYQRFTSPSSLSEEDSEQEEELEEEEEKMSSPIQEPCKSGLLQITGQRNYSLKRNFLLFLLPQRNFHFLI